MSRKPRSQMAPFNPAIQPDIWGRSSWVPRPEQSSLTTVDTTTRLTSTGPLTGMRATIPTLHHTAERIMEQPITTRRQEPMAGRRPPTARTDRRPEEPRITRTPAPPREGPRSRHPTAAEVQHRPIIRTREPMLRLGKVRVRPLSGAAPMCRTETRAPTHNITRLQTEQSDRSRVRKVAKPWARVPHGGTRRRAKPPAEICMPGTMVTFTKTPAMVGRSTTTAAGIQWTSLRLRPIGAGQKTRSSGPAPETLTPIERAKAVIIEVARKPAAQVVAAAIIDPAEVRPPKCKTCKEKPRTGNAAPRKASASSKVLVVEREAAAGDAAAVAGAGAKRCNSDGGYCPLARVTMGAKRALRTANHH